MEILPSVTVAASEMINCLFIIFSSAGVGRTGTFIAIDHLLQHLKEHPYVDIYGIVYEMRKQRNLMVQTEVKNVLEHLDRFLFLFLCLEHRFSFLQGG